MCFVPNTPSNTITDSRCCFGSLTCAQFICAVQNSTIVNEDNNIWCDMDGLVNDRAYRQDNGTVCKEGDRGWCLGGFGVQSSSDRMVKRSARERVGKVMVLVLLGLGIWNGIFA
ncbi:uncharacterized protein L199_002616 [Kwoniella botswanensis]|uniref:uncharacterized protein n=1 Tax=Kwoniella botswanensis TaxID=1268659 RepID=UPI00315CA480